LNWSAGRVTLAFLGRARREAAEDFVRFLNVVMDFEDMAFPFPGRDRMKAR
jgi:hypothetical protein